MRLYDYQKEGVLFAARAGRWLIGDEMGLGKTIQAISATEIMAALLGVERARRLPNVAQASMAARDEFFRITNYDTVHTDLDLIARWSPDLVILDEAQRIKNWSMRTARSVKQIASPYAIVLTGTPLENRIRGARVDRGVHRPIPLRPYVPAARRSSVRDENGRVVGYRDLDRLGTTLAPVLINGPVEGCNSKIRRISHLAFGFHSGGALIAMIMLLCSGITVSPLGHG